MHAVAPSRMHGNEREFVMALQLGGWRGVSKWCAVEEQQAKGGGEKRLAEAAAKGQGKESERRGKI